MENLHVSKFRWIALVTLVVASIAQGMTLISPAPLIGELVKVLGVSLGQATGATMGPFILCVALSAIIGGIIIDKFGLAFTYFISLVLMILGSILIPVIGDSLPGLVVARIIQGIGCGPVIASTSKVAAEWFPQKERALVTGLQGSALSLGIAVGFAAAPAVFAKTGNWQTALTAMAAVSAVGLVLNTIFAMGPQAPNEAGTANGLSGNLVSELALRKTIRLPVFWIGIFGAFLLSWAMQGYNDITPGHLAIEEPVGLGLGPVVAGRYMGLLQVAFVLGSAVSGVLVQKLFHGVHRYLVSLGFIMTGIFCVSVLLPMVNSNQLILLICLLLAGFFMGMPIPSILAFISAVYPENITGRVGGVTMGIAILGGTLGVIIGSAALHMSGMYTISICVVGGICLIGFINGFGLTRPQGVFEKS